MTSRIGLLCTALLLLTPACHRASPSDGSGLNPTPGTAPTETRPTDAATQDGDDASDTAPTAQQAESTADAPDLLAHTVTGIDGEPLALEHFRGQVLLLVNTASECGFTSQYADLQEIHDRFHDRGFSVIAFPCNDFGGQEPGSEEEIAAFCTGEFGVSFPMTARVQITEDPHPLWRDLQTHPDDDITGPVQWNFTKFLVDRDGQAIHRWPPPVRPNADEVVAAIEAALE